MYINVPLKRNKHKNLEKKYFLASWSLPYWRKEQDPKPDPLAKGADSRIRIRTKMSRIRNALSNSLIYLSILIIAFLKVCIQGIVQKVVGLTI